MTSTLPSPVLPEWATIPASAEMVRNPDWIAAKLRDALKSDHPKALAELVLGDISLWTSAAEELVAAITDRPSLPRVAWHRHYGPVYRLLDHDGLASWTPQLDALISDWQHTDQAAVAQQWATALRLREVADPRSGTRAWDGVHEGWYVRVWIITDRAAFDA